MPEQLRAIRRHCWVAGTPDHPGPKPGLILEWRKQGKVWMAGVVYLAHGPDESVATERWVGDYDIRPA